MSDYDQILDAAELLSRERTWETDGLCWAFYHSPSWPHEELVYRTVPRYLRALGGHARNGYFWPCSQEGNDQRLTFLAFMLAWLENP